MIALVGVVVLAAAGVGVAVLSAVAARHPDRAAMLVVLTAAAGGVAVLGVLLLGVTAIGMGGQQATGGVPGPVRYHPQRLSGGITLAVVCLAIAAWMLRGGGGDRQDG